MALTEFFSWKKDKSKLPGSDHVTGFSTLHTIDEDDKNRKKNKKRNKVKRKPSFTVPRNPYKYKYGPLPAPDPTSKTWTHYQSMRFRGALPKWTCMSSLNQKISSNIKQDEVAEWLSRQRFQEVKIA